MAHFYGSIKGCAKTEGTRRGTKKTGLSAHVRGWDVGVRVELAHVAGVDVVTVFRTGGSNGAESSALLCFDTKGNLSLGPAAVQTAQPEAPDPQPEDLHCLSISKGCMESQPCVCACRGCKAARAEGGRGTATSDGPTARRIGKVAHD